MENATTTKKLNIKPAVQKALDVLSERNADMLASRYGISRMGDVVAERETLESIGRRYNITRERVRQIEEASYHKIRNAEVFSLLNPAMSAVGEFLRAQGGIAKEEQLTRELVAEPQRPHLGLLLALGPFVKIKESDAHNPSWAIDSAHAEVATAILNEVEARVVKAESPLSEEELFAMVAAANNGRLALSQEAAPALLAVSKTLQKGPFGQWGIAHWPEVNPRGVRDKAYLVFDREDQPLHFRDIARLIDAAPFARSLSARGTQAGGVKTTHPQTVHNELIKDDRFVLVGRGIYALAKWGYTPGTVKDVIVEVLKQEGTPLEKEEIIDRVLQQRMVQKNTILLNLQNRGHFAKTEEGKFYLA